jgi:phosphonatase-like hydrolase
VREPARDPIIRLAVLDMAGTTVSDNGVVERAFREAMGGRPTAEALRYVRSTMGQSKITVFRALCGGDEPAAQACNLRFECAYDAAVDRGEISPIAGAEHAIAELRMNSVQVCLTTGFSASTRDRIIDALGWRDAIDLVLSPEDAGRGRPFPDMILTALLRLEVDDVRHVAVAGDTASDLIAGSRAGAGVVAGVLTGAHARADLVQAPHTHIIDSITDFPALLLGSSPALLPGEPPTSLPP